MRWNTVSFSGVHEIYGFRRWAVQCTRSKRTREKKMRAAEIIVIVIRIICAEEHKEKREKRKIVFWALMMSHDFIVGKRTPVHIPAVRFSVDPWRPNRFSFSFLISEWPTILRVITDLNYQILEARKHFRHISFVLVAAITGTTVHTPHASKIDKFTLKTQAGWHRFPVSK